MIYRLFSILFLVPLSWALPAQDALNLELYAQYDHNDGRASGSWAYISPTGEEYALLGAQTGTVIVSIDSDTPQELAFIPGPTSNWREITVIGQHAYVTTEGSSDDHPGMQVISLENLPEEANLVATFNSTFTKGHIIQKDIFDPAPYVYVCGTSTTSGIHIIDVSDPENPQQVGLYQPGYYIHDCHVRGDTLFAAAFYEGTTDIVDISDKSNPVLISSIPDPGGNTHSYSTTEDNQYLIVADEQDGLPGRIYDISDLSNPEQVALYTASSLSLFHNPYVRGDFCFVSHNTEGLRVLDITDPTTPVEVGYYDTYGGPSGGFNGLWSACPYFPSGKIIGGNRENGLYVWTFNNTRAGRFYGTVIDTEQGAPIVNASVVQLENSTTYNTNFDGQFRGGNVPGSYTFQVSAIGYESKMVPVVLEEGENLSLTIELTPITSHTNALAPDPGLSVFPNPSARQTTIQWQKNANASTLLLSNSEGKIISQFSVGKVQSMEIYTGELPTGFYHFVLIGKNGEIIGRNTLIVQ